MKNKISILFAILFATLSCSCNTPTQKTHTIETKNAPLPQVPELAPGKTFFSGDELQAVTYVKGANTLVDSLSYSLYADTAGRFFVFALEKLLSWEDVEKYRILDTVMIQNAKDSSAVALSEQQLGDLKILTLNVNNTLRKTWQFPVASAQNQGVPPAANGSDVLSLSEVYEGATEQPLPLLYSYDLIFNDALFPQLGFRARSPLPMDFSTDWRLLKLPRSGAIRPFIAIGMQESGQEIWYLTTLSATGIVIDTLEIYTSIELENGGSLSKTFSIAPDYVVTLTTEKIEGNGEKPTKGIVRKERFQMSKAGRFERLRK